MKNLYPSTSHEKTKSNLNTLKNEINAICTNLLEILSLHPNSVADYGISISNKLWTEFVDRIINNISLLKLHFYDLEKYIHSDSLNRERIEEITKWLSEVSDKLKEFLLSNNFYQNTFEWAIKELDNMIKKVLNTMPIGAYYASQK